MTRSSSPVFSNQTGTHPDLEAILKKHLSTPYKKPYQSFSHGVFQQVDAIQKNLNLPVVLDSGCGTGDSTQKLSEQYPDHLVIGIDKSEKRLEKFIKDKVVYHNNNLILARAELIDMWRMINKADWNVKKHYLLYPNPWPKKDQIKRRWYGHPVFPEMINLCYHVELRTNWHVYAEEFQLVLKRMTNKIVALEVMNKTNEFISPFEKKYFKSGHELYRVSTF